MNTSIPSRSVFHFYVLMKMYSVLSFGCFDVKRHLIVIKHVLSISHNHLTWDMMIRLD